MNRGWWKLGLLKPVDLRTAEDPRATYGPSPDIDHRHRDVNGGSARAAVFGLSDGLVSNISIVLGVAGAHPGGGIVRLAGTAGLVGGAFSMAAGEYVSMRAQTELVERELDLERHSIENRPEKEREELASIYQDRGMEPVMAEALATELMRDPEVALETHAREEMGVNPGALGSPQKASLSSFGSFAVGAVVPLVPWFVTSGTAAIIASIVSGAVAALAIGGALSIFTGRPWWYSALRQLGISVAAAAITYAVGRGIGTSST